MPNPTFFISTRFVKRSPERDLRRPQAGGHRRCARQAGLRQGDAAARGSIADARIDHRRVPQVEPQRIRRNAAALAGAAPAKRLPKPAYSGARNADKWGMTGAVRRSRWLGAVAKRLPLARRADRRPDEHLDGSASRDAFRAALPQSGVSGTLANRLKRHAGGRSGLGEDRIDVERPSLSGY